MPRLILLLSLSQWQNNATRKQRRLEQNGIKPALQVYFPGITIVGQPYMAIIPFYISGKVTLNKEPVQMNRYYHAYGECPLSVKDEPGSSGKLGAWVYKLGNQGLK